jgi:DNA-binding NarL/FixJ family response regulator
MEEASPETAARPVQVWLVDDNNRLRSLIAECLERQGSINCTRQFDSPNGLLSTLASRTGPDVILLDVQMGEWNGLDALPAIKSLARETRVFMLTTFFDPAWHKQAMESGASGYHLKGDSMEQLVQSIRDRSGIGVPVRRRTRRAACSTLPGKSSSAARQPSGAGPNSVRPARKTVPLFGWLKRLASN